jgi:hypothetical protein
MEQCQGKAAGGKMGDKFRVVVCHSTSALMPPRDTVA